MVISISSAEETKKRKIEKKIQQTTTKPGRQISSLVPLPVSPHPQPYWSPVTNMSFLLVIVL